MNGEINSLSYETCKIRGVYVDTVQVNLNSENVKITPAVPAAFSEADGYYPCISLSKFVKTYKPSAAINGTFFDTVTGRPVGTIVINGKLVYSGFIGVAVCVDKENQVTFHHVTGLGRNLDWSPFEGVICSGPSLVSEGEIDLAPKYEGFKDPSVFSSNRRSAIGITEYNKLLFVTVKSKITLKTLAFIMKDMGCVYAVNLDGGSSSALYYKGKYITYTSRAISSAILVYENKDKVPSALMEKKF